MVSNIDSHKEYCWPLKAMREKKVWNIWNNFFSFFHTILNGRESNKGPD